MGGPLTRGPDNGILTGIVSWGIGCARPNLYGIYTHVSDATIRNFIDRTIDPPFTVGTFSPGAGYAYSNGDWLAADVNGNGKTDLIHRHDGGVNTWLSNGDGTWDITGHQPWPGYAYSNGDWLAADVNGNGKTDLIHRHDGGVNTWLSNGDGTWDSRGTSRGRATPIPTATGWPPTSTVTARPT